MPIMKPKTILNTILLAPTKNMDTSTSLVMPYDMMVDAKSRSRKAKYMTNVDEYGPTNIVNIAPKTANTIKNPATKIVVSIVTLPKNNRCRPTKNNKNPINIQLSSNTCQILDTENTGQPYLVFPFIFNRFYVSW